MRIVLCGVLAGTLLLGAWLAPAAAQETAEPTAGADAAPTAGSERGAAAETEASEAPQRRVRRGELVGILQDIHLGPDEEARTVVCIGCNAVIEGKVTRDVVVVGGTIEISGEVSREMVAVLSDVTLRPGAQIGADFVHVLGQFDDEGAEFEGSHVNLDFPISIFPLIDTPFGVLAGIVATAKLIGLVLTLFCILILVIFVPERIRTMSDEVPVGLLRAYVYGALGYLFLWIAKPIVYTLLVVTVVGIPLIPAIEVAIALLKILGLAGLLHYIGLRMGHAIGRDMSLAGAILLGFLPFAVVLVLPAFFGLVGLAISGLASFLFWLLVKLPALGLVIATRCGTRRSAPPETPPGVPRAEAPPPPEPVPPAVPGA